MSEFSSSTISIDAPIAEVGATLFAVASYPEWSASFKKAEVLETDEQGRALKAKLTVDAGPVKDVVTLVFDWTSAPSKVTFSLEDANLLTKMDGAYLLKSIDADTTSVTYELSVGLSMPIPAMMITKQEKSTIDSALKQLKEHLEG
jgi:ribosome-associated toxin RatA of RatAB toxin-antitoxin module